MNKNIILLIVIVLSAFLVVSCTTSNINVKTDNTNKTEIQNNNQVQDNQVKEETKKESEQIKAEEEKVSEPVVDSESDAVVSNVEEQKEESNLPKVDPENKAHYSLTSNPSDADVYVDSVLYGKTPIEIDVNAGLRKVELVKYGYVTHMIYAVINKDETKKVSVKLVLQTGLIDVSSTPSRAMVYLNGVYRGKTPMKVNGTFGENNISLTYTGYEKYFTSVMVEPNKMAAVSADLVESTS